MQKKDRPTHFPLEIALSFHYAFGFTLKNTIQIQSHLYIDSNAKVTNVTAVHGNNTGYCPLAARASNHVCKRETRLFKVFIPEFQSEYVLRLLLQAQEKN